MLVVTYKQTSNLDCNRLFRRRHALKSQTPVYLSCALSLTVEKVGNRTMCSELDSPILFQMVEGNDSERTGLVV